MTDTRSLMHWHKPGVEPSELSAPPECCQAALRGIIDRDRTAARRHEEAAVHDERRRVVLGTLAEVERYANALTSVLEGERATLATKIMNHVVEAIRGVGCICPMVDASALGDPPGSRLIPGGDARCGVHGG